VTDGGSPWYISTAFTPRRFDVADLRVLFDEWAESEGASRLEDVVLEGVIALTQGHRGWTMMLAGELVGVKPSPQRGGVGRTQHSWRRVSTPPGS
jgi:hypothetical protein